MFSGIASLLLSSGLWLTAMAANPLGTEIARNHGVNIGFGSWLLEARAMDPTLACAITLRALSPDVCGTVGSQATLNRLGGLSPD